MESDRGLLYLDITEELKNKGEHAMDLFQTVAKNASRYNKRDYLKAVQARKLQNMIGQPTTKKFLGYIKDNIISNFPLTRPDILSAEDIFGPDVGTLKGKATSSNNCAVHGRIANIPARVIERYKNVILSADIMKANKIPFIITISKNICFITGEHIGDIKFKTLVTPIKKVKKECMQSGFCVTEIFMDGQFELI